jgi:predicted ester cyclase
MSTAGNKAIVRRFIEEVFVQGRPEAVDELVAEDFVAHSWGPMPPGRDGLKRAMERVARGLADVGMRIEDEIAEGDHVVVRIISHARQVGEFMGMPASNREYTIEDTVRDGRIVEHRHQADFVGMMRQLGAMPDPG